MMSLITSKLMTNSIANITLKALLQIYKSYIRAHQDYYDVIDHKQTHDEFYSKHYSERAKSEPVITNSEFTNKIESVQYNAVLAITGCVRETSREKLFSELGLASLYHRRRFHRLSRSRSHVERTCSCKLNNNN